MWSVSVVQNDVSSENQWSWNTRFKITIWHRPTVVYKFYKRFLSIQSVVGLGTWSHQITLTLHPQHALVIGYIDTSAILRRKASASNGKKRQKVLIMIKRSRNKTHIQLGRKQNNNKIHHRSALFLATISFRKECQFLFHTREVSIHMQSRAQQQPHTPHL